MYTQVGYGE